MATVNSLPEWPTNCYAQEICVLACHPPLSRLAYVKIKGIYTVLLSPPSPTHIACMDIVYAKNFVGRYTNSVKQIIRHLREI